MGITMPVYEFYCSNCNTIYKFLSQKVNTDKIPSCPKCEKEKLERRPSSFSIISNSGSEEDELDDIPIDESKLESAMQSMASDIENIDEEDPRSMAKLMRKFSNKTGIKYNDKMEEALARLESGEDPEKIEQDMDELLEDEEMPFDFEKKKKLNRKLEKPNIDDTLYDL